MSHTDDTAPAAEALELSDPELISRVREGDVAAYGTLFQRHVDAANRLRGCSSGAPTPTTSSPRLS